MSGESDHQIDIVIAGLDQESSTCGEYSIGGNGFHKHQARRCESLSNLSRFGIGRQIPIPDLRGQPQRREKAGSAQRDWNGAPGQNLDDTMNDVKARCVHPRTGHRPRLVPTSGAEPLTGELTNLTNATL